MKMSGCYLLTVNALRCIAIIEFMSLRLIINNMTTIQKILVATDMSERSNKAFEYASLLAEKCAAELVIVNVFDTFERMASTKEKLAEIAETLKKDGSEKLQQYADQAKAAGVKNVKVERTEGNAAEVILRLSKREKPDMIVLGSRGLSTAKEFLLGSVSHKISHHAECPVLIVR